MLYRVYARSSRLNAVLNVVKQIHTSPSSYGQKPKPAPRKAPSLPVLREKAKEGAKVGKPYGEYHTLLLFPRG
jgi:hypothetical protein